jgi:RpiR family carbohydrate utilization transcriptional regulator
MLDRIKASLPSLAPAEQRVGRLVLGDPRSFANLPVSELADRAHVSKPDRGALLPQHGLRRPVGLSSSSWPGSVSEGVPFIHRSVDVDDKTGDVLVKVIDNTVAAFLKYRNDASTFASSRPPRRWPPPTRPGAGSSSTASATRASWRRTRSTSSSGSASTPSPTATATCR